MKAYFLFILILIGALTAFGQNTVQPDSGRGITKIGNKFGINTNGAVTGYVLTYDPSSPFWSAPSGGSSGAAALTNSFNYWTTASYNIFNGPTLHSGAVTNNALFVMPTVFSFDPTGQRFIYHQNGQPWADFNQDFGDTGLYYTNGQRAININFGSGGSGAGITIQDGGGTTIGWIGGGSTKFRASNGSDSVDVENRGLYYGNGQVSAFWWFGSPGMQINGALTNAGSAFIATNLTTGTAGKTTINNPLFANVSVTNNSGVWNLGTVTNASSTHTIGTASFAGLVRNTSSVTNSGTTWFTGAVTNEGAVQMNSTLNGMNLANFVTNTQASTDSVITWDISNLHAPKPALNYGIVVTNNATALIRGNTTYTTGVVYTVTSTDRYIVALDTNNHVRIMYPTSGSTGREITVIKGGDSGYSTIIDAGASKNINGFTNQTLSTKYQFINSFDTGTEWLNH